MRLDRSPTPMDTPEDPAPFLPDSRVDEGAGGLVAGDSGPAREARRLSKPALLTAALVALVLLNVFFLSALLFSRLVLQGESVGVPDVIGKTASEARADLIKKDLLLVTSGREFHDEIERDHIIRQDPAPGGRMRVTQSVRVVLSAGEREVQVPELAGRMLEALPPILRESRLSRGTISQIHTPRHPAGRIIAQRPPAGSTVDRNGPVSLLVSQGARDERFLMPDLIGRRAVPTIARLKALGFRVDDIRQKYYPGYEEGIILNQSPPGGHLVLKRSRITLEVSRS